MTSLHVSVHISGINILSCYETEQHFKQVAEKNVVHMFIILFLWILAVSKIIKKKVLHMYIS
jgi:hypothetical protein